MKADTICCYCVSKRMTKEAYAESLHAQITRARLTACEVGVFSREISISNFFRYKLTKVNRLRNIC